MDELNLNHVFIEANESLISSLEDDSDTKILLQGIHDFHNKNIFHYAEIQLGLAKCLDFKISDEKMSALQQQINKVVILAYKILQIHINQCKQHHEDGACLIGGISYIRVNTNLSYQGCSTLPIAHALNFSGKIDPIILPAGTKIYRIIGKNKKGHWWLENKPLSKTIWRSESAVSEQWNNGKQCIEIELKGKLSVWRGIAASQAVPMSPSNCYLKGGAYQLWLDPSTLPSLPQPYSWP